MPALSMHIGARNAVLYMTIAQNCLFFCTCCWLIDELSGLTMAKLNDLAPYPQSWG